MATKMVRGGQEEDITNMLPVDAWLRGLTLILVTPKYDVDPVYLVGRYGVIREWDYIPSLGEVDEASRS